MDNTTAEATFTRHCLYATDGDGYETVSAADMRDEVAQWLEMSGSIGRHEMTTRDGFDVCLIAAHTDAGHVVTYWVAPIMDNADSDYYATCTTGAQYRYRAASVFDAMKMHNATRPDLRASVASWQEADRPGRKGMVYHWHESA